MVLRLLNQHLEIIKDMNEEERKALFREIVGDMVRNGAQNLQLVMGDGTMIINNGKEKDDKHVDLSPALIAQIGESIKGNRMLKWAHVYYAMIEVCGMEQKSAEAFGDFIHQQVPSISSSTVRHSGDFVNAVYERQNVESAIKLLRAPLVNQ